MSFLIQGMWCGLILHHSDRKQTVRSTVRVNDAPNTARFKRQHVCNRPPSLIFYYIIWTNIISASHSAVCFFVCFVLFTSIRSTLICLCSYSHRWVMTSPSALLLCIICHWHLQNTHKHSRDLFNMSGTGHMFVHVCRMLITAHIMTENIKIRFYLFYFCSFRLIRSSVMFDCWAALIIMTKIIII